MFYCTCEIAPYHKIVILSRTCILAWQHLDKSYFAFYLLSCSYQLASLFHRVVLDTAVM